jgi:RNA polymerase sigma-70 factor (ECF subfamily)
MDGTAVTADAALAVDEADLTRAAAAGDGSAFAALYERYEQGAFNLAYRISGSEADAADAVQEAFLNVMRRLPRLADRERPFGFHLFRATHNACYDPTRTRPSETIPKLAAPLGSGAAGPSQQEEIHDASMRLPERQREVLALRDLEGLSYDEIAAIMEIGSHAVAQLISRARINLRDELGGTALASVAAPSAECERALPLISARDDGELEAASREAAWLDAHLAGCDRCALGVEVMQEARASYRAWAPIATVPWLFEETMAKAAELRGADWSEAIAGTGAASASAESLPDTPPAHGARPRRRKASRRRLAFAAGLAVLLLFAGLAAALVGDEPPATPAGPAADAAPTLGVGAAKPATKPTKAGKPKGSAAKKKLKTPTTAASTLASPQMTASGATGEPASGPSRPPGATAVQPTQQTSTPKPKTTPTPAPAAASQPASTPAPAPAPEESAPAAEPSAAPPHGHEPPGRPPDRPPR